MAGSSLLVKNADVLVTMDPQRRVLRNASVYIENNVIRAVGSASDVDYDASRTIDVEGKIVLPGLVNTHHHLFQTMYRNIPLMQNAGLFEWLTDFYDIWREITLEAIYISAKVGIAELLLSGCTSTSDHLYVFPPGEKRLISEEIRAAEELGIRFHTCRGGMSRGRAQGGLPPDDIVQSEEELISFYKRLVEKFHDPAPYSMIRVALAPCSPFSVTTALLEETREIAKKYKVHRHTHLAETREEDQYCKKTFGTRPLAYLDSIGWVEEDVWLAHGIHLNREEIKKLAHTGTGISYCPSSNMRLGAGIAPVRAMLRAGVRVGIGVDGSASNEASNMLNELRMAMLLQRVKYGTRGMSAPQALELATVGGAGVLGRNDLGSIEPGKAADLISIDLHQVQYAGALLDPLAALVFCHSHRVDTSIINGKIVVENGAIVGLDLEELIARHNELARCIIASAEEHTGKSYTAAHYD